MKKLLIFLPLFISLKLSAQKLIADKIIAAKHSSFEISSVKRHGEETDGIAVHNINNRFNGQHPQINEDQIDLYDKMDKSTLIKSFRTVFSQARLEQLSESEKGLNLMLYVSSNGKVLEVEFGVKKQTSMQLSELENLEDALKTDIKFDLKGTDTKNATFFLLPMSVIYRSIINGDVR